MSVLPDRRPVTRRAAARAIAAGALAALAAPRSLLGGSLLARPTTGAPRAGTSPLRVGVLRAPALDRASRAAASGIALGADESRRGAALLRRTLTIREGTADELLGDGVDAILGGATRSEREAIAAAAARAPLVWLDLACSDAERPVVPHAFRIAPGPATRRTIDARVTRAGDVLLWHPSLERFGAGQLNARFAARFGEPMTSAAWAGWVAMKIAWESFLRLDAARAETLAAFLASPRARFDGHKGRALYFDPATHELRQPLYIVSESDEEARPAIEEIAPPEPAGRRDAS